MDNLRPPKKSKNVNNSLILSIKILKKLIEFNSKEHIEENIRQFGQSDYHRKTWSEICNFIQLKTEKLISFLLKNTTSFFSGLNLPL